MSPNPNLFMFYSHAGFVVKCVMLLLLCASIMSWTIILQRMHHYKQLQRHDQAFKKQWLHNTSFEPFYETCLHRSHSLRGMAKSCFDGMQAWEHATVQDCHSERSQRLQRAMDLTTHSTLTPLNERMGLLATIGSVSPYVGLFGTVWGIMSAFMSLGQAQQATIAMVAPGIAEALIATAIGLFAAIPAVIAYNLFGQQWHRLSEQYQWLQQQLLAHLESQHPTHPGANAHHA